MITDLIDTTSSDIGAALIDAHRTLGASSGQVFTLVIVSDAEHSEEVAGLSQLAGREHPSRVIVCVSQPGGPDRLDARLRVREDMPGDLMTLTLSGQVAAHPASVLRPLLLPDLPIIVWWPLDAPDNPSEDPIGSLAHRRVTDAANATRPSEALAIRACEHTPGDTDLTWTRLTPWRAMLAAALDQHTQPVRGGKVAAGEGNCPAALLAAWLTDRLGVPFALEASPGPGITEVTLATDGGTISLSRVDGQRATYTLPGRQPRQVSLRRRSRSELLLEELRRIDVDDVFDRTMQVIADSAHRDGALTWGATR